MNYIVVKLENDYTYHLIDLNVYKKIIKRNHIFFYMIIKLVHNYILHINNQYILQEITNTTYVCVCVTYTMILKQTYNKKHFKNLYMCVTYIWLWTHTWKTISIRPPYLPHLWQVCFFLGKFSSSGNTKKRATNNLVFRINIFHFLFWKNQ